MNMQSRSTLRRSGRTEVTLTLHDAELSVWLSGENFCLYQAGLSSCEHNLANFRNPFSGTCSADVVRYHITRRVTTAEPNSST